MDIELIERFITSVGFPIAMCGVLIYYIVKWTGKQTEELQELKQAINNNTNAINALQTIMKIIYRDEK